LPGPQSCTSGVGSPPVINSPLNSTGTVGVAYSYQITATNSPTSFGASPLPNGLTVNTGTGKITGTPVSAGTTTVILSATNGSGTGTASMTLVISPTTGGGTGGGGTNTTPDTPVLNVPAYLPVNAQITAKYMGLDPAEHYMWTLTPVIQIPS